MLPFFGSYISGDVTMLPGYMTSLPGDVTKICLFGPMKMHVVLHVGLTRWYNVSPVKFVCLFIWGV